MPTSIESNTILLSNSAIRRKVSFHEAGHLIAYGLYCKELGVNSIDAILCSIKPNDTENLGFVRAKPIIPFEIAKSLLTLYSGDSKDQYPEFNNRTRLQVKYQIKYNLAGLASECLLQKQDDYQSLIEENESGDD